MATAITIPMSTIESSQLDSIGHSRDTNTLAIRFKAKGGKPGSLYLYQNVTPEDYAALTGAESIGSHFYKVIKPAADKHPFVRIVEDQPTEGAAS